MTTDMMLKSFQKIAVFGLCGILCAMFFMGRISDTAFAEGSVPVISGVSYTHLPNGDVQIRWSTNDPADSVVEFGLTSGSYTYSFTNGPFCDGAQSVGTVHCVTLTNVPSGMTYFYRVASQNSNGSAVSPVSSFVTPTTADTIPPSPPVSITAQRIPMSNQIGVIFSTAVDNVGVVGYDIYRNSNLITHVNAPTTSYIDEDAPVATACVYYVIAIDSAGNRSLPSANAIVAVSVAGDTIPPSNPTGLVIPYVSPTKVTLHWNTATDNVGVDRYKIYRGGTPMTEIGTSLTNSFDDTTVVVGTGYYYSVSAVDAAGNTSAQSGTLFVNILPLAPDLSIQSTTTNSVTLAWTPNTAGVTGYKLYRITGTTPTDIGNRTSPHTDSGLAPGTYGYKVQAYVQINGGYLMYSSPSNVVTVTVGGLTAPLPDATPPSVPSLTVTPVSSTQVSLSFLDATDDVGIVGFEIYRNNSRITPSMITSRTFTDSTVLPGTTYTYYVKAFDTKNYGTSPTKTVTTPGGTTTPLPTTTTTTTTSPTVTTSTLPVTVSVSRGGSVCELGVAKTPYTFSASPQGGATIRVTAVTNTSTATDVAPGTHMLRNGVYHWDAFAQSGYALSGKTADDIEVNFLCPTTVPETASTSMSTSASSSVVTLGTPSATIELIGAKILNVAKHAPYRDPGAKGYLTAGGTAVTPTTDLGGLNTALPGRYQVTYRLFGPHGALLATNSRTVIVFEPDLPKADAVRNIIPLPPEATTSTSSTEFPIEALPLSESAIATRAQSVLYCDDIEHKLACAKYVTQRVASSTELPPMVLFTEEVFGKLVAQGATIPAGASSTVELGYACGRAEYALACAELYVKSGILNRQIAEQNARQVENWQAENQKVIEDRVGARMFVDTDGDGISDYDEVNVYHTNPGVSDTNGDGSSDGNQILAGTDPRATTSIRSIDVSRPGLVGSHEGAVGSKIIYDDPNFAGEVNPNLVVSTVQPLVTENESGATTTYIVLSGRALPNSFVTLFIFSDPIVVTVKSDDAGVWTYTSTRELPDGSHKVLSAITDSNGRILVKSTPLPFVKTASAVTMNSGDLLPATNQAPGFFSGTSLYVFSLLLLIVFGGALAVIGWSTRKKNEVITLSDIIDAQENKQ